jgi:hypothetical protein
MSSFVFSTPQALSHEFISGSPYVLLQKKFYFVPRDPPHEEIEFVRHKDEDQYCSIETNIKIQII